MNNTLCEISLGRMAWWGGIGGTECEKERAREGQSNFFTITTPGSDSERV